MWFIKVASRHESILHLHMVFRYFSDDFAFYLEGIIKNSGIFECSSWVIKIKLRRVRIYLAFRVNQYTHGR